MKSRNWLTNIGLLALLSFGYGCQNPQIDRIDINGKSIGNKIPTSLYGVFFEEISHSGDGGIYAEMIQNRGFEDGTLPSGTILKNGYACAPSQHCYSNDSINEFKIKWNDNKSMNAWNIISHDGSKVAYDISTAYPLNSATPHSLHINLEMNKSPLSIINHGYWGIAVCIFRRIPVQHFR